MVSFSLAILAGMGLDYYIENLKVNPDLTWALKAILILAFVSAFFYLVINLNFSWFVNYLYKKALELIPSFQEQKEKLAQLVYMSIYNIKRAIGYFMALSVCMFLGSKKIRLNFVVPALLTISFLDIYTVNKIIYLNMDIDEYLEPGQTINFIKKDNSLFRVFDSPTTLRQNIFVPEKDYFEGVRSLKERLVSNKGVSLGIYDAYGYGSLYNRRHEEIMDIIIKSGSPNETNLLNLLNVKYVVSPKDFEADGYRLVKKGEKANVYENEDVLPRAFVADRPIVIKDEKKILERLKSRDFDPAKEVILEEDFSFPPSTIYRLPSEKVDILKYSPAEVTVKAQISESKFLVLSDSYYPGWKVYVDDRKSKIFRADYILRAVHLEPGRHIVRFMYAPFSFKIGVIVTLLTISIISYFYWRLTFLKA
jgi:hypothetical protein